MTTSYDYGAALDGTACPAQIYNCFRTEIAKHVSNILAIPATPSLSLKNNSDPDCNRIIVKRYGSLYVTGERKKWVS
jgi:hypothetical protein